MQDINKTTLQDLLANAVHNVRTLQHSECKDISILKVLEERVPLSQYTRPILISAFKHACKLQNRYSGNDDFPLISQPYRLSEVAFIAMILDALEYLQSLLNTLNTTIFVMRVRSSHPDTVDYLQWGDWEEIPLSKAMEIQTYINAGKGHYELKHVIRSELTAEMSMLVNL